MREVIVDNFDGIVMSAIVGQRVQVDEKGIFRLDGITANSNKQELENAIACLECSDETLDKYLTVIELKYPNTYRTITNNGDKQHIFLFDVAAEE